MPRLLELQDRTTIRIEDEHFGEGGTGKVYRILEPISLKNQVVKLYYDNKRTHETELKIKNLASRTIKQSEHESIVWIKDIVYECGKFAGFTMNYADGINFSDFLSPSAYSVQTDHQIPSQIDHQFCWRKMLE